jgi:hypothetical protein
MQQISMNNEKMKRHEDIFLHPKLSKLQHT